MLSANARCPDLFISSVDVNLAVLFADTPRIDDLHLRYDSSGQSLFLSALPFCSASQHVCLVSVSSAHRLQRVSAWQSWRAPALPPPVCAAAAHVGRKQHWD